MSILNEISSFWSLTNYLYCLGISPKKEFLLRKTITNPLGIFSGFKCNLFSFKSSYSKFFKLLKSSNFPDILLLDMSILIRVVILKIEGGNWPCNLLFFKLRIIKLDNKFKQLGMVPLNKLSSSLRIWRCSIVKIFERIDL